MGDNSDLPTFDFPFSYSGFHAGGPPKTLKEQLLCRVMGAIKEKSDWMMKVFDDEIVGKWREELMSVGGLRRVKGDGDSEEEGEESERGKSRVVGAEEREEEEENVGGEDLSVPLSLETPMRLTAMLRNPTSALPKVDADVIDYAITELQWLAANHDGSPFLPSAVEGVYVLPHASTTVLTGTLTTAAAGTLTAAATGTLTAAAAGTAATTAESNSNHCQLASRQEAVSCGSATPAASAKVASLTSTSNLSASPSPSSPPSPTLQALLSAVHRLEDVPEGEVDYHPGSSNQVVDLVHPSLYCLVYGRSRMLQDRRGRLVVPSWKEMELAYGTQVVPPPSGIQPWDKQWWSGRFQWLPSEVDVAADGSTATFRSYVNNLHPELFPDAYAAMGDIFARCFVPLFNRVLTDLANPRGNRITADPYAWYRAWERENDCDPASFQGEEDEDERLEEYHARRQPQQPAVPLFEPPSEPMHVVELRGRRVQVIVKVASIRLTPDKPEYPGGTWHVEGAKNESIVATGIFYFDSLNITGSRLQFRQAVDEPSYEQSDDRGVMHVYGLVNDSPLVQYCGSVPTDAPDTCIAFPNKLQHRLTPFSLKDRTKPGHRKILVFFLVDPKRRIPSTASVPPQQAAWKRMLFDRPWHPLSLLPSLSLDLIVKHMSEDEESGVMSDEQARRYREELMSERQAVVVHANEVFEREFSLCEH